jgi:RNA-directed DNA polymerase
VLSIPTIRDHVVQGALKLILEPIFEADFQSGSYGWPKRSAHQAVARVSEAITQGKTRVLDFYLRSYFDNIRHHLLFEKVAQRVNDPEVMQLLKLLVKATGAKGRSQGGVLSPTAQQPIPERGRPDAGASSGCHPPRSLYLFGVRTIRR